MRIAFFTYYINHHQVYVADQLYELTGHNYTFVETESMSQARRNLGYEDFSSRPYILQTWKSNENKLKAMSLAEDADVVLYGITDLSFLYRRVRKTDKLTFVVNERWLKRGLFNLLSPRLLKFLWCYFTKLRNRPVYYLCASAFAKRDLNMMGMFRDRCYKWGYFPNADFENRPIDIPSSCKCVRMMWCARFLAWKHPELPVMLAARLKSKGYDVSVDMYGSGEKLEDTKALAQRIGVDDMVHFYGARPNSEIMSEMEQHSIFLFTSDRNEGWGAVANEAMSRGCILVGSDKIGSVPYLVDDGKNGCSFRSSSVFYGFGRCVLSDRNALDSLCDRVEWLLNNRDVWPGISQRAKNTMRNIWSPKVAAQNLMALIQSLESQNETPILEGPCSKA